jgi:hypothetical protein
MAVKVLQGWILLCVFMWMCIRYGHEDAGDGARAAYFGTSIPEIIGRWLTQNGVTWLGLRI